MPTLPRKPPKKLIFQEDQLKDFKVKYQMNNLDDVETYLKTALEYEKFRLFMSESGLTAYKIHINSGIAKVQDFIHIDSELRVKLSFEGLPIPLPEYIRNYLTSLDTLTNLPNYCKNHIAHDSCYIGVYKKICSINANTSNSTYKYLKQYLPLPSETVLTQLKSPSIQSGAALCGFRDNDLIGNDVVFTPG